MGIEELKNIGGESNGIQSGEPKRGRGRPKGSTKNNSNSSPGSGASTPGGENTSSLFIPSSVFLVLVNIPFDLWSQGTGVDFLKLTEEERNSLAVSSEQVFKTYCPQIPVEKICLINLSMTLLFAVSSRLMGLANLRRVKKEAEAKKAETVTPANV